MLYFITILSGVFSSVRGLILGLRLTMSLPNGVILYMYLVVNRLVFFNLLVQT